MFQKRIQNFNDGCVGIYAVTNTAAKGKKPTDGITLRESLRYEERTVGITRFYAAMQAEVKVSYVLRCQRLRTVSTKDIAIPNDGLQYRIVQIQYPEDVVPAAMDLTLEAITAQYLVTGGG